MAVTDVFLITGQDRQDRQAGAISTGTILAKRSDFLQAREFVLTFAEVVGEAEVPDRRWITELKPN